MSENDKLDLSSPDLVNENFEKLAELFPNCVTESAEGKAIDFDLLKQELSHAVVEGNKERYRLEWPGKKEAIVTANLPTNKTLRPIRGDSVDFDNTENIYIEGDNLEVLKLLQESYLGKVKMIYIDPPYNTGKDFVYKDNFAKDSQEELVDSGQKDEYNQRLVSNPETSGRYHSDWLSMMYPRLKLARNLLTQDGLIFISIDDNEQHNLRRLCDDVFGENNKLGIITNINNPKGRSDDKFIATAHEYIIVYGKASDYTTVYGFEPDTKITKRYNKEDINGKKFREIDLRKTGDADKRSDRPDMFYYFYALEENPNDLIVSKEKANQPNRIEIIPLKDDNSDGRWRWGFQTAKENLDSLYAKFMPTRKIWGVFEKDYLDGRPPVKATSSWTHKDVNSERGSEQMIELGFDKETFSRPKPLGTLRRVMEIGIMPKEKSIVLDFFSGSAGICQAMFELVASGKRDLSFIAVQLPENTPKDSIAREEGFDNITDIARERIKRSAKKIKEETGADIDYGFRVYRLDDSNMEDVYYKPQEYAQDKLDLFADNVKSGRTSDDLLAQVMLDWGLPLSLKIEQVKVEGKKVFKVAENSLFACFDDGIDEAFAKAIAEEQPLRIVFKDSGFKDDTAKTNVKQLLKQLSPETEMKVI
ncbi:site-specific DNA-methyltransferase [Flagellimonas lutimaris]|uniref:site-specific DNA-methyltransferase (adenine-specific) n=1 Tax=Flagellimonas lutimaris TaxID=475082 RepID=A0A3A1NEA4_9FLAO|nr:site-specific DNA-methyltransferase [Allomuricauda lutimaris]RIV37492.1 site-specific DNA-methyltransferase [Allomuricauda lutimaris]